MYNLIISGLTEAWEGEPFDLELGRCVREYTDDDLTEKFGALEDAQIAALQRLPCIFGYENGCKKNPKFGVLSEITRRRGDVRLRYQIIGIEPFITWQQLESLSIDLDISKWELNRTHWAVKNVNLARELHSKSGITLPPWAGSTARTVDITKHGFDVGLSFPGEARGTVEPVARELEAELGPHTYFYDDNYVSQLARPSLDTLLQDIYRNRSRLIVVFLSGDYESKEWCGVEFRAIREIIMGRDHQRIMYVKIDDGPVKGVFKTDGYVDARKYSPKDIARFIVERVQVLRDADR